MERPVRKVRTPASIEKSPPRLWVEPVSALAVGRVCVPREYEVVVSVRVAG
jgi:hypothetical protein